MQKVLGDKRAILILLGPALLIYSLVMLVPIVWSLYYTVQDGNPIVGFTFNGLGNFVKFFQDPAAWDAVFFTLKYAVILTALQVALGYGLSLLYAGLVDIPEELIESARIDGASGWKLIRTIIIPLSLPVLLSSIIFSINGTLKVFDTVIALTAGGPGNATTPLTLYMFRTSFAYGDYGYGSTIALMLTILCLLFTVFIFRSTRRDLTKE